MIPLGYVLAVAAALFGIGLFGALARTNAVRILLAIELMLNAVNLNLVAFSRYVGGAGVPTEGGSGAAAPAFVGYPAGMAAGQVFATMVVTVAAAEAAVGMAIILMIVRHRDVADLEQINLLKW